MVTKKATPESETVKEGKDTTEYKRTKSASTWGTVGMILGAVVTFGPSLVGNLQEGSKLFIVAGTVISVCSIAYKTFIDAGYIASRTQVKTSKGK